MTDECVFRIARRILRQFRTRDPFVLAAAAGVTVRYAPFSDIKGMYQTVLKNPFIILKDDLSSPEARMVCMHELGHHYLHRDLAASRPFRTLSQTDPKDRPELEANLFAAEVLIPGKRLLELLAAGLTVRQAAAALDVNQEMVLLKISMLPGFRDRVVRPRGRFLGA